MQQHTESKRRLLRHWKHGSTYAGLPIRFVCSALGFTLSAEVIVETAEASMSSNIAVKDMLGAEFCVQTAEREVQRRLSKRKS